jgi:hypothetical protein
MNRLYAHALHAWRAAWDICVIWHTSHYFTKNNNNRKYYNFNSIEFFNIEASLQQNQLFAATVCREFAAAIFFILRVKFAAKLPQPFAATLPRLAAK